MKGLQYNEQSKVFTITKDFNNTNIKEIFPNDCLVLKIKHPNLNLNCISLPSSLTKLVLGDKHNLGLYLRKRPEYKLKNFLPNKLQVFKIKNTKILIDKNTFPDNLKKFIYFNNIKPLQKIKISYLPPTLEYFDYFSDYDSLENLSFKLFNNLFIIRINRYDFYSLQEIPNNVKYLEIYNNLHNDHNLKCNFIINHIEYLVLNSNGIEPDDYYTNGEPSIILKNSEWIDNDKYEIYFTKESIQKFNNSMSNLKYLSLDGNKYQKFLLNNLPDNLEVIRFTNLQIEVNNLPFLLKKIIIDDQQKINLITKIPFGCEVTTYTEDIYINDYLIKNNELQHHKKYLQKN